MAHAVRVTGFDSSSKRPAAAKHSSTDLKVRLRSFAVLDAIQRPRYRNGRKVPTKSIASIAGQVYVAALSFHLEKNDLRVEFTFLL